MRKPVHFNPLAGLALCLSMITAGWTLVLPFNAKAQDKPNILVI